MSVPDRYAYAGENQAAALVLPAQTGGWGLLLYGTPRETVACERALVAALEEHEADIPGWDTRLTWRADGWPGDADGQMTWRR